jgi:hypothetical protein
LSSIKNEKNHGKFNKFATFPVGMNKLVQLLGYRFGDRGVGLLFPLWCPSYCLPNRFREVLLVGKAAGKKNWLPTPSSAQLRIHVTMPPLPYKSS